MKRRKEPKQKRRIRKIREAVRKLVREGYATAVILANFPELTEADLT